jgi:hypothetical protein
VKFSDDVLFCPTRTTDFDFDTCGSRFPKYQNLYYMAKKKISASSCSNSATFAGCKYYSRISHLLIVVVSKSQARKTMFSSVKRVMAFLMFCSEECLLYIQSSKRSSKFSKPPLTSLKGRDAIDQATCVLSACIVTLPFFKMKITSTNVSASAKITQILHLAVKDFRSRLAEQNVMCFSLRLSSLYPYPKEESFDKYFCLCQTIL